MRRWRRHVAEPGARSPARTDADTSSNANADANTDADTHAHAHAHAYTYTYAEQWDDHHHHVRWRLTQDADRAARNTRHVREQ